MQIKYLPQAKLDLVDIGDYYQKSGGNALARKIIQKIKKPTLKLKDNPNIAPPYELAEGVRRLVVANGIFYVFYRAIIDVEILHIRQAHREPATERDLQ